MKNKSQEEVQNEGLKVLLKRCIDFSSKFNSTFMKPVSIELHNDYLSLLKEARTIMDRLMSVDPELNNKSNRYYDFNESNVSLNKRAKVEIFNFANSSIKILMNPYKFENTVHLATDSFSQNMKRIHTEFESASKG